MALIFNHRNIPHSLLEGVNRYRCKPDIEMQRLKGSIGSKAAVQPGKRSGNPSRWAAQLLGQGRRITQLSAR
jgi:hypothetical protein